MPVLLPTLVSSPSIGLPIPRKPRRLSRTLLRGCLLGAIVAFAVEALRMLVGTNSHVVLPERVYRSAQLSPADLEAMVRKNHIRTVINLRGCCQTFPWYTDECRTTQNLDISQEDITLSANRLPSPIEIRRLVEVLDHAEYPILLHCRRGADRTGLAAMMVMLLYTDADYSTAHRQCSPLYGHWPILTTASMDEFFEMYAQQLAHEKSTHTPARFRRWLLYEYCPGIGKGELEVTTKALVSKAGESPYFQVRATNRSHEPWHFKPGTFTGVYLDVTVVDATGKVLVRHRFGQQEKIVQPGEAIDIEVALPVLRLPGRYLMNIDLAERQIAFAQYGSGMISMEWVVTP